MKLSRIHIFIFFVFAISLVNQGCKTQEKATVALTNQQQLESAQRRLKEAMDNETLSTDAKLKVIEEIRSLELTDAALNAALDKNEQFLNEQKNIDAEIERRRIEREREENIRKEKQAKVKTDLLSYFNRISQAADIETANKLIEEALTLFDSRNSPVLVIIKKTGSLKEYDRPSSIIRYLEHIKDFKTYENKIENITFSEDNGKISELELIK